MLDGELSMHNNYFLDLIDAAIRSVHANRGDLTGGVPLLKQSMGGHIRQVPGAFNILSRLRSRSVVTAMPCDLTTDYADWQFFQGAGGRKSHDCHITYALWQDI